MSLFSEKLLTWFDEEKRTLPWRTPLKNPYAIWLSEIMLQQTTVVTVVPYFQAFMNKWPTVQDLANASLDEVLHMWQGLGYYSRARNLHKCAKELAQHFPQTEKDLIKLPGIGPYTAAAIASIAFEQKAAAIDGNVIRVISRYFTLKQNDQVKPQLQTLMPEKRYGDFTEALMELGALVCRPKNPQCKICPLNSECIAFKQGSVDQFPIKVKKKKLPTRHATAYILKRDDGAILLRKRPLKGLLGGMMEVPTTPWEEKPSDSKNKAHVRHTFTHFHLEVTICQSTDLKAYEGIWVKPEDLKNYALPTVIKKILTMGLNPCFE